MTQLIDASIKHHFKDVVFNDGTLGAISVIAPLCIVSNNATNVEKLTNVYPNFIIDKRTNSKVWYLDEAHEIKVASEEFMYLFMRTDVAISVFGWINN